MLFITIKTKPHLKNLNEVLRIVFKLGKSNMLHTKLVTVIFSLLIGFFIIKWAGFEILKNILFLLSSH